MAEKWELTVYCDKCDAHQHFTGETPAECAWEAQHAEWIKLDNGKLLCSKCQQDD